MFADGLTQLTGPSTIIAQLVLADLELTIHARLQKIDGNSRRTLRVPGTCSLITSIHERGAAGLAQRFATHVEQNIGMRLTVNTIADVLRCTPKALSRAVRGRFQCSVRAYIKQKRLSSAYEWVREGVKIDAVIVALDIGIERCSSRTSGIDLAYCQAPSVTSGASRAISNSLAKGASACQGTPVVRGWHEMAEAFIVGLRNGIVVCCGRCQRTAVPF
jgi:AraC-like DNA-binding protein